MAENKRTKKPVASKKKTTLKKHTSPSLFNQFAPYIIGFVAIFLAACFFVTKEYVGFAKYIGTFLCGLFSCGAYTIPFFLFYMAIFYRKNLTNNVHRQKWIYMAIAVVFISVMFSLFSPIENYNIKEHYISGTKLTGGGVVGGFVYNATATLIGPVGVCILAIIALLVFITLVFGRTPEYIFKKTVSGVTGFFRNIAETIRDSAGEEEETETEAETEQEQNGQLKILPVQKQKNSRKDKYQVDIPIDDAPSDIELDQPLLELEKNGERMPKEACDPEVEKDINDTLINIFASDTSDDIHREVSPEETFFPETLEAETDEDNPEKYTDSRDLLPDETKEQIITDTPAAPAENIYRFPPISLLHREEASKFSSDDTYRRVGEKLVDTLKSFRVNTEIINISKGPAITRYELKPEKGIKVKSIINLADDIALNLAATGVRIEAPIPGKDAVGVEIPNTTVSTVYVRDLIENPVFTNAKSKLTACLGMNVAGEPVYCDVAKMPHLLIAGATGMGKSVCINSLIISLLYKATPDELKLILIDPKKVELSIYNGIPHLLVPVVSEPKRAAGSLCWAVGEMERRFALIEEVGVRDIKSYNEAVKFYEEREKLPHIVIIIDELADLMMTAKDDVESSICRLAQKARAAGMHLIIGTQRPSVDVITGLIKANIPSRIAFTVASQVDSRTIIDISGAEKLIGRGDMLYAPVGVSKPVRVQGAFVSENEVESVTGFIKESVKAEYSDEVIKSIEEEAEKCGDKKTRGLSSSSEGGKGSLDSDEMLKPAIEIAFEAGAISASLIQRRLSLGYARASRLVDTMYDLGIIGPFSGAKPRQVIISRERYNEMLMNSHDE
ncbi:MAG: DNA translocase FtsK 4TM domain-containing protein [Clostridia bacterium]|nr:DNA translocase FtsK 4TM domain-containing protein [Clostridia bacterium]